MKIRFSIPHPLNFVQNTSGSVTVEFIVTLPLLFLLLTATYEFYEVHRYRSVREKATYTIADMISREQGEDDKTHIDLASEFVTDEYIDNSLLLFNDVVNDSGDNQIRISMLQFNANNGPEGQFEVEWSEVRGGGKLLPLTDDLVVNAHDSLPIRSNGQYLIVVDSESTYDPLFNVGFNSDMDIYTRVFTDLRFASQLRYFPPDVANTDDPRDDEVDGGGS